MRVIAIQQKNSKKVMVTFGNGMIWPMYKGELRKFDIREDTELSEDVYEEVYKSVILKRAKLRGMNLLIAQDRTESQIRDKLKQDGYYSSTIDEVIQYLISYHYIDDYRFAGNYCEFHKENMSIIEMRRKLLYKGVSSEVINSILESLEGNEESAINLWIEKKRYRETIVDDKSYQKAVAFLMRKGFSYELISKELRNYKADNVEY